MCSSCRKGGFNKAVNIVQQTQRSVQQAQPVMDIYINDMNEKKYKKMYYIGADGIVTGGMHSSYGFRKYGEQMYVHVNDITDQFAEEMPPEQTEVKEPTSNVFVVPNKKTRKQKSEIV